MSLTIFCKKHRLTISKIFKSKLIFYSIVEYSVEYNVEFPKFTLIRATKSTLISLISIFIYEIRAKTL
jgi:hypothetical protein